MVVRGAGLARHGPVQLVALGACAAGGHALKALDELVSAHGIQYLLRGGTAVCLQHPAVAVRDLLDEEGHRGLQAAIGDGRVSAHHLLQREVAGPEGHAGIGRDIACHATFAGEVDDVEDAGLLQGAHGGDVAGIAERLPDGNGPPEIPLIVLGFVGLHAGSQGLEVRGAVRVGDGHVIHGVQKAGGDVLDHGGGGLPGGEGGAVDVGLHGGAHLAQGLGGAVELGAVEIVAAHHGADLAAHGIHGHEGPFHLGILVQLQALGGAILGTLHRKERRGAAGQQFLDVLACPGEGAFGHVQLARTDAHLGLAALPAEDDAPHAVALLKVALPPIELGGLGI